MQVISRRAVVAGLVAGIAGPVGSGPVLAEAPLTAPRPPARPTRAAGGVAVAAAEGLIAEAKLGGEVAYVVADAATGLILEARRADTPMPPASTLKTITTLYALAHLPRDHRFATRMLATGPMSGGRLQGGLMLAGGGDPVLSTDDLGDLAAALADRGLRDVEGGLSVWAGALPFVRAVDPGQPSWFGYNPSVAGMNLNFNRVNFTWARSGDDFRLGMDARGERFVPEVSVVGATLADRDLPVFTYDGDGPREMWTVARSALNDEGSRWLPVRRPAVYAGDVMAALLRARGIGSGAVTAADAVPAGATVLVERESDPLTVLMKDMMKFSTNLTAEAIGMRASLAGGIADHAASAAAMTDWFRGATGAARASFVDHSGLGGASRITAGEMARALATLGRAAGIKPLMREITVKDLGGKGPVPVRIEAKTGTLNFVSSLVGYVTPPMGREMVFAIFTGDVARRDAVPDDQKESPPGGSAWVRRSKRLQLQLIDRWARLYAV